MLVSAHVGESSCPYPKVAMPFSGDGNSTQRISLRDRPSRSRRNEHLARCVAMAQSLWHSNVPYLETFTIPLQYDAPIRCINGS